LTGPAQLGDNNVIAQTRCPDRVSILAFTLKGLGHEAEEQTRLPGDCACEELGGPDSGVEVVEPLTKTEMVVLEWLSTPLTQRRIAGELFVSLNTVKSHCRSIFRKLGVCSRDDAVVCARALNLLGETNGGGDRYASFHERELATKQREMADHERAIAASADGMSRDLHQQVARVHDRAAELHDRLAEMDYLRSAHARRPYCSAVDESAESPAASLQR